MQLIDNNLVQSGKAQVENAFGFGTPGEMLVGSFLLGIAIIATGALSLGWTLLLLPIPMFLFFLGVVRLIPAVERRWPL